MKPHLSIFLNVARWAAAFLVLISHCRLLLFTSYGQVDDKNPLLLLFYIVTGLGHEAVVIFFVISGLLVGGITLQRWKKRGVDLQTYFAHRISRIYTVLLPALCFGAVLDLLGTELFNESGIYTNALAYQITSVKGELVKDVTLPVLLGNLLMLHPEYVPIMGSNGPLWSLSYEWWYYMLFAASVSFFFSESMLRKCLGIVVLGIIGAFAHDHLLLWGLIWLLGVGTWFYKDSKLPALPTWLSGALFALAMAASRYHTHRVGEGADVSLAELFAYDAAIGLSFASLIISVARREGLNIPRPDLHHRLADFSYTLYAAHFPMLLFFTALCHDTFGLPYHGQPGIVQCIYLCAAAAVLYSLCWSFAQGTEKNTRTVRDWLEAHPLFRR